MKRILVFCFVLAMALTLFTGCRGRGNVSTTTDGMVDGTNNTTATNSTNGTGSTNNTQSTNSTNGTDGANHTGNGEGIPEASATMPVPGTTEGAGTTAPSSKSAGPRQ